MGLWQATLYVLYVTSESQGKDFSVWCACSIMPPASLMSSGASAGYLTSALGKLAGQDEIILHRLDEEGLVNLTDN